MSDTYVFEEMDELMEALHAVLCYIGPCEVTAVDDPVEKRVGFHLVGCFHEEPDRVTSLMIPQDFSLLPPSEETDGYRDPKSGLHAWFGEFVNRKFLAELLSLRCIWDDQWFYSHFLNTLKSKTRG